MKNNARDKQCPTHEQVKTPFVEGRLCAFCLQVHTPGTHRSQILQLSPKTVTWMPFLCAENIQRWFYSNTEHRKLQDALKPSMEASGQSRSTAQHRVGQSRYREDPTSGARTPGGTCLWGTGTPRTLWHLRCCSVHEAPEQLAQGRCLDWPGSECHAGA